MNRRNFLGIFGAAPAVILTPGLLMPVRPIWTPSLQGWAPVDPSFTMADYQRAYTRVMRELMNNVNMAWFDSRKLLLLQSQPDE